MDKSTIDFSRVNTASGDWELFETTPTMRRYRLEFEPGSFIIRTEYLADESLQEENRQLFNDSQSKRFGDGRVVARIPMNKLYSDFAGRWTDDDFAKWWLGRDDNRPFRTFRGKV